MTAPRQILPGVTSLVTRRCFQRHFFLRPSKSTNQLFLYLLAVASSRFGIKVHAFCVLSNHYHLVVTDPEALLPKFIQLLDALVARALNGSLGRREDFWSSAPFSAVSLLTPGDVVDKAAYTLANPVAAGLVRSARQWPGLWSDPNSIEAAPLLVRRPDRFFDENGTLPATAALALTAPPGFSSARAFRDELLAALAQREAAAVRTRASFMGILKVLSQRPTECPRDKEPLRRLSPRIASRDKWRRIEALGRLKCFMQAYREAWANWQTDKTTVFPAGTFLMRLVHGAACAGAG